MTTEKPLTNFCPMRTLKYNNYFMEENNMNFFKKNTNKETTKLPMDGKVKKGFRAYCSIVAATTMIIVFHLIDGSLLYPILSLNRLKAASLL